ncbi:MAG TPA: GTPase [Oxalicibacterium sp.]|nr:GTPase [Oxalicibacterium sp.]
MTLLTLVTGGSAGTREAAIAAQLDPAQSAAVILEGLPDGKDVLLSAATSHLQVVRIAPGCMHCTGNLVMRVTLNRMLRERPPRLYISVASTEHLDLLREFLRAPPYDALLTLTDELSCASGK